MPTSSEILENPILVTGGAGFIGSHLVRRLVKDNYDVCILTRKESDLDRIDDVAKKISIVYDDLSDGEKLGKLLARVNPSGIFHMAASNIKSGVAASEEELVKVNTLGTMHLLRALENIDYKFFINSGSYLEYGSKTSPLKEDDLCQPLEAYALSKLSATLYCQAIARAKNKPILTFRIFSPYGPGMESGRLVHEVTKRAIGNEEIMLTKPETSRDFISVFDIVDIYIEAMNKASSLGGEIFNLGSGKATTLKSLAELILRITASKSPTKWGTAKETVYDRGCQEADMQKTFSAFSWRPRYNLEDGLRQIVSWLAGSARKK